ncbi:MAG: hypothetical protein ACXWT1_08130 [Methylobacter sp.]
MKINEKFMLLAVHEKHEKARGRMGFVTPSLTFQNIYKYTKRYGTGRLGTYFWNKPILAFFAERITTKQLEQAS